MTVDEEEDVPAMNKNNNNNMATCSSCDDYLLHLVYLPVSFSEAILQLVTCKKARKSDMREVEVSRKKA